VHTLALAGLLFPGCSGSVDSTPIRVIDLLNEFDRAERRPVPGYAAAAYAVDGVSYPAILMPVPSRITWSVPLPRRGRLRTRAALAPAEAGTSPVLARFRIGISDHRIYEGLTDKLATDRDGWVDFAVDLSAYAGWQWSLFYRPDSVTWNVVLAADAGGGGKASVAWAAPEILTDVSAAREYVSRRHR
jgi:hypothetical protein